MASTDKFTGKADGYSKYRPRYPEKCIDYLISSNSLNEICTVADVGSGTGILTGQLLGRGLTVKAVEPNGDMRGMAKQSLGAFPLFVSVDGTAENTTLDAGSVDLVTAAQAFHWFDHDKFRLECRRILKEGAKVALIWNSREYSSRFVQENEEICAKYCPNFVAFGSGIESTPGVFDAFFKGGSFEYNTFRNDVQYDLDGFLGRNLSGSYAPFESDVNYSGFVFELTVLFEKYLENGLVTMPQITECYLGAV